MYRNDEFLMATLMDSRVKNQPKLLPTLASLLLEEVAEQHQDYFGGF